jgi:IS30 family transposase
MKITAEAIYQWIYREPHHCSEDGTSMDLRKCLIRARKKRGMQRKISKSKIKERVSIHARPDNINKRVEFGHYEGDLIFNEVSQSMNVLTLTERTTRYTIMIRNDNKRSETVIDALIRYVKETGIVIKSITFDNGSEFTEHLKLKAIGILTYFCDPGSPWQKGSCENLNGASRRYLPFDMPAHIITDSLVKIANEAINNIPREILRLRPVIFQTKMLR